VRFLFPQIEINRLVQDIIGKVNHVVPPFFTIKTDRYDTISRSPWSRVIHYTPAKSVRPGHFDLIPFPC
jgi:hypothetical protein